MVKSANLRPNTFTFIVIAVGLGLMGAFWKNEPFWLAALLSLLLLVAGAVNVYVRLEMSRINKAAK